jgi:hypothetical protein
MGRILAIAAAALLLFAGAVWYAQHLPPPPLGYAGLQFAPMTRAASGRTPDLDKGALVLAVEPESPAAKAGIAAGAVIAAVDGEKMLSARQAAEKIAAYHVGASAKLVVYETGEVRPQTLTLVFAPAPDPAKLKKYSVHPPPVLAKEGYRLPPMAANAAWAKRLARGAATEPMPLNGIGAGRCNGMAPERWRVAGASPDGGLLHLTMPGRFQHALTLRAMLTGESPENFIRLLLEEKFRSPVKLSPSRPQPFGFAQLGFGNEKGGTGFVQYRVKAGIIQLWIAAAAAGEADWALPIAGAVAFTLNCGSGAAPRVPALVLTSVSAQCLAGKCQDADFAASYMTALKLGYVHDAQGHTYLINPKRDFWIGGDAGPGYYHQVGGDNEKLEPGRTNDSPKG